MTAIAVLGKLVGTGRRSMLVMGIGMVPRGVVGLIAPERVLHASVDTPFEMSHIGGNGQFQVPASGGFDH